MLTPPLKICGVLQGSCLGPFLVFNLMNDLKRAELTIRIWSMLLQNDTAFIQLCHGLIKTAVIGHSNCHFYGPLITISIYPFDFPSKIAKVHLQP